MGWILAVAFHDDPVMTWAIPDDPRRRATLPAAMELLAEYFQPLGANRVNESGTGAAVWSPPGVTPGPDADAGLTAGLEASCPDDLGLGTARRCGPCGESRTVLASRVR